MSGIPSEVPQRPAGPEGFGRARSGDVPEEPQGPGAGDQAQPVIGTPGATIQQVHTEREPTPAEGPKD